jgi:hypothetical protein
MKALNFNFALKVIDVRQLRILSSQLPIADHLPSTTFLCQSSIAVS